MLVARNSSGNAEPSLITYGNDGLACILPLGRAHISLKVGRMRVFHYQRGGAARAAVALDQAHALTLVAVDLGGTVATLETREEDSDEEKDSDEEEDHAKPRAGPILRRRTLSSKEPFMVSKLFADDFEEVLAQRATESVDRAWSQLREEEALRASKRTHEAQIADIEESLEHVRRQVLKLAKDNEQLPEKERLDR